MNQSITVNTTAERISGKTYEENYYMTAICIDRTWFLLAT
jgi:hypothetical protein